MVIRYLLIIHKRLICFNRMFFLILVATTLYGPIPQLATRSFNVGTISVEIYLESVLGYVRTLCCSYSFCIMDNVCLPEKPKIRLASRCRSVKSYNVGAYVFFLLFLQFFLHSNHYFSIFQEDPWPCLH